MPPITESEQIIQLREEVESMRKGQEKMNIKLDMLIIALRGNTDIDPGDKGALGKIKWLTGEVLTLKRQRERVVGMVAGGVAVGAAAGTFISILVNHFLTK